MDNYNSNLKMIHFTKKIALYNTDWNKKIKFHCGIENKNFRRNNYWLFIHLEEKMPSKSIPAFTIHGENFLLNNFDFFLIICFFFTSVSRYSYFSKVENVFFLNSLRKLKLITCIIFSAIVIMLMFPKQLLTYKINNFRWFDI